MSKLIKRTNKKGFTLVELIVVIAIIAVLALILVPAVSSYVNDANRSKNQASVRSLFSEASLILASNRLEAGEGEELSDLIINELKRDNPTVTGEIKVEINDPGTAIDFVSLTVGEDTFTFPEQP